ncbi:hypothetical protein NLX83_13855 [Allokutzneria sp. A3M-2-11 16]|uniref:hypothetical protein n=1 Tax=Allokutzneria sp. A3M-2-11 16 TaxID=2962043 RepID=UPI0020B7B4A4|nr:hypothetical protein [Allokutzneria sp. A3M-2-11 16]MCP3800344.1 hypothetical protein [Allokutzneria sp. A3M-2-11 16]
MTFPIPIQDPLPFEHGESPDASAKPLTVGEQIQAVMELLTTTAQNASQVARIVAAIVHASRANRGTVTANSLRPWLDGVHPPLVGSVIRRLALARVLSVTGHYVQCTAKRSGNGGKLQRVYRYHAPSRATD